MALSSRMGSTVNPREQHIESIAKDSHTTHRDYRNCLVSTKATATPCRPKIYQTLRIPVACNRNRLCECHAIPRICWIFARTSPYGKITVNFRLDVVGASPGKVRRIFFSFASAEGRKRLFQLYLSPITPHEEALP